MKILIVLVLLVICVSQSYHMEMDDNDANQENFQQMLENNKASYHEVKSRSKRGIFWDFFQKMIITKNLVVDQYTDTRDSLNEVYNLLNDQFSDPAASKPRRPTTSTESPKSSEETTDSSEVTTTTEAYRISRYELGRVLGRNFRGLKRLQDIEFQDALNQTKYNLLEYKAEANKQFANSLAVEKKNKIKSIVG